MLEHAHESAGHFSLVAEPLEALLAPLLEGAGLSEAWTHALVHALADFIDISLLVLLVVAVVSYVQTFIPYEKMRSRLAKLHGWLGCGLALGLGVLSPFCSCSIIPILLGFLAAGVPLPYCLVFLSSASALNLTALGAVFTGFPIRFALWYLLCALAVCLGGSLLAGSFGASSLVRLDRLQVSHAHHHHERAQLGRLRTALCSAGNVYKNVWLFLLLGVVCSTLVAAFVSQDLVRSLLVGNPLALPLATLVGGALHSDVFSILPIAQMLLEHSLPVALCFLLATMLFSIAEWALLSQAFRPKLIARYCGCLLLGALACGLLASVAAGF